MVLLSGFVKKTPANELKVAKDRRDDVLNSNGGSSDE